MSYCVDDNYVAVGSHIDSTLHEKILRSEYVDFAKLLPRDRSYNEDNRMELINKGGQTFFIPACDKESSHSISGFGKWEQAFRVFSRVFLQEYPECATELVQYNHVIYTASLSYTWENVYNYDREFRTHISNFPDRSWATILQQAWSLCLKDKISNNFSQNKQGNKGSKDICKRFNKGQCTAGRNCRYEHKCCGCGKFGHGVHICHNKSSTTDGTASNSTQKK